MNASSMECVEGESALNHGQESKTNLEDLFPDNESEDEYGSGNDNQKAKELRTVLTPQALDPEVLRSYYQRLFPWRHLFQWLNHSPVPSNDFGHREFAFTLPNDAYLRYQSFPTSDVIRKDILRLNPTRFEIGPVYSTNPRDRKSLTKSSSFKPISKELCFDIDLTDYDDIRTCCSKVSICQKCWQFITMAIKVIDVALREDFGFKHIMWVYSGRRGAHAWVCDKRARNLNDQKRKAIAGYLMVIKGGIQSGKRVDLKRPLHPHVMRSLNVLKAHFQNDILQDQDPWETDEKFERLLQLIPDQNLKSALLKKWSSSPGRTSIAKWADIDSLAKSGVSKTLDATALLEAKQDIVLEYTYPRLDIEVTKHLNHLLKSPFVVHPGTGRVCVPIDAKKCEDFDPLAVPTVVELLREIDEWKDDGKSDEKASNSAHDWDKTRLKPYIEHFRSFVILLLKDEKDTVIKRERDENEDIKF
ncbi:DNA primase small subunit [Erysiphe neolycopersici]|uniref:DNA primase n=1 Tax=Erysiphe neolycopersici TaxID=212602 RepID=A0A420I0I1_9PEZI|nr:DNA primase small subunit [Erysiphe neolycopersici]